MRTPRNAWWPLIALLLGACQQAPPVEEKPKRKSFAEGGQGPPASRPAEASGDFDARAQQARETMDRALATSDEAEQRRLAGEALEQSRALADPPADGQ